MIISACGNLRVVELDYGCDVALDCAVGEQMALLILLLVGLLRLGIFVIKSGLIRVDGPVFASPPLPRSAIRQMVGRRRVGRDLDTAVEDVAVEPVKELVLGYYEAILVFLSWAEFLKDGEYVRSMAL